MYVSSLNPSLEFSLKLGKVDVKSFVRNGVRVKAFKRRDYLKAKEGVENLLESPEVSLLRNANRTGTNLLVSSGKNTKQAAKNFVKGGDLPSRKNTFKILGENIVEGIKNPSKAIKDGLAREALVMEYVSQQQGKKVPRASVLFDGLKATNANIDAFLGEPDTYKELVVNTGGFITSVGGKLTGIPGLGLAGDYLGARATRRGYDDFQIMEKAMSKIQGDLAYSNSSRLEKVKGFFKESKQLRKELDFQKKARSDKAGDVGGWATGNLMGAAIPVPLSGAPFGIVGSKVSEKMEKLIPPKTLEEALAQVTVDFIDKGNKKEENLRKQVKNTWQVVNT